MYNRNPYTLLSAKYADNIPITLSNSEVAITDSQDSSRSKQVLLKKSNVGEDQTRHSTSKFAQRFVDEIAPANKMREYENIAFVQKNSLLKESAILQQRYSENVLESQKMERSVLGISSMITEFLSMLEEQSEQIEDMNETSKEATKSVRGTDAELKLTIQRSESHQWNMVILINGLAIMLLLLHFLTPWQFGLNTFDIASYLLYRV